MTCAPNDTDRCGLRTCIVRELAERIEPFDFWAFEIDEPGALATGGSYVDPVYF